MKNTAVFSLFAMALFVFTSCGGGQEHDDAANQDPKSDEKVTPSGPVTYSINPKSSTVEWEGNMTGLKVYAHSGTVLVKEGEVTIDKGQITKGKIVVDLTSINPTDENYSDEDGKRAQDLVGHLSSPDFFDVANHPTAMFTTSTMSENALKGKMTVRGKTEDEKVEDVAFAIKGDTLELKGKMKFDRQKYGVAFEHPVKELLLSDEIELVFNVTATAN